MRISELLLEAKLQLPLEFFALYYLHDLYSLFYIILALCSQQNTKSPQFFRMWWVLAFTMNGLVCETKQVLWKFTALKRHSLQKRLRYFAQNLELLLRKEGKNYFKMFFCPQEQYPDRIKEIPISPNVFTLSSHVLFLQRHWTRGSGLEYACRIVMQSKGARLTMRYVDARDRGCAKMFRQ